MLEQVLALEAFGARPALVSPAGTIAYGALAARVAAEAERFAALGLAAGDRCLFVCGDDGETVIRALALLARGCAVLPLSAQLGAAERRDAARAFDARWLVPGGAGDAAPQRADPAAPAARGAAAGGPALDAAVAQGLFSSGSTGTPKIVLRSAQQLRAYAGIYAAGMDLSPEDRVAVLLPFSFAYGFNSLMLGTLAAGASLVFPGARHPRAVRTAIRQQGVTLLASTPTFLDLMVRFADGPNDDLAGVRRCVATGEPLSAALAERFAGTFGQTLWNNYGSSETGPIAAERKGTADGEAIALGQPHPGVEIRLCDEQGRRVPDGEVGEIVVRSPAVGLGYAIPGGGLEPFAAGTFATGDLGRIQGGVLCFAGRRKLLLNSAGRKVDPLEIEQALRRHPQVVDAAVVGQREGEREVIRALVVAEGAVGAGELMDFCAASLAAWKVPRIIEFRPALPRSESGKLIRSRL